MAFPPTAYFIEHCGRQFIFALIRVIPHFDWRQNKFPFIYSNLVSYITCWVIINTEAQNIRSGNNSIVLALTEPVWVILCSFSLVRICSFRARTISPCTSGRCRHMNMLCNELSAGTPPNIKPLSGSVNNKAVKYKGKVRPLSHTHN